MMRSVTTSRPFPGFLFGALYPFSHVSRMGWDAAPECASNQGWALSCRCRVFGKAGLRRISGCTFMHSLPL